EQPTARFGRSLTVPTIPYPSGTRSETGPSRVNTYQRFAKHQPTVLANMPHCGYNPAHGNQL
ncbi:MAG: hypothetical protein KDH90_24135, partial [Anaerolineae bacterium]|nr:hypothetical protein [Anaerolineae bacterium]